MSGAAAPPHFRERPSEAIVNDAWLPAGLAAFACALALYWGALWISLPLALLSLSMLLFFRNPERALPSESEAPDAVVAPADGRVLSVEEIEEEGGEKRLRIAIFLSVFDVHVNRAPVAGRVVSRERRGTRYFAAFKPEALHHNVSHRLELEMADGRRVGVVQITGWVARRIVCHPEVGEWLTRGARFGFIRFGSRTDVLLPRGSEARVKAGDRVRGGASVVAALRGAE